MKPARPVRAHLGPELPAWALWLEEHEVALSIVLGGIVAAAIVGMAVFHVGRDNDLKLQLATLRDQARACEDVRDLATAIDNTPSGSRLEAGRTLARR